MLGARSGVLLRSRTGRKYAMKTDKPGARVQRLPLRHLHPSREAFVLLDNSSGRGTPSQLFTAPKSIVVAHTPEEVPASFAALEAGRAEGLYAAGFFSFELGYVLEPKLQPLLPRSARFPLMWFGLYEAPKLLSEAEVDRWLSTHTKSGSYQFSNVSQAWSKDEYVARFEKVQEKIRAGDIYQLNLTFKARFRLSGSPLTFISRSQAAAARCLRRHRRYREVTVLTASPELFVEMKGRTIETRPMKGTSRRGGTPEADAELRQILSSDAKQRAENLMIVDLMRNDIGRISEIGSEQVTDLFHSEDVPHAASNDVGVRATLLEGITFVRSLAGYFSAGFGDWGAEDPCAGADRRIRDGAARGLLRRNRFAVTRWTGAVQRRDSLADYFPRWQRRDGDRVGRRL